MKELVKMFDQNKIRTVILKGEPWFVAKDVAEALGYTNTNDAINTHCRGVAKRYPILDSLGRTQEVRIIAEPDLYRLIFSSNLPAAERFERWVVEEVLPSIRKTGKYRVTEEARHESTSARTALCRQWQEHGAEKFYHFANLTKAEYEAVFGDRAKKKADMTREELGVLMVFESVEYLKLVKNDQVKGYRALDDSLRTTARQLPLFTTMSIEA